MLTKVELDNYHYSARYLRSVGDYGSVSQIELLRAAHTIDALITEVINLQATIQRMKDQADHISWGHCDL